MTYRFDDDNSTLISGHRLARSVKRSTIAERALIGVNLHFGRLNIECPTILQSAALVDVCPQYVSAASKIAGDQQKRAALLAGELSFAELVRPATKNGNGDLASHLAQATDEELIEAARTVGVKAVWERMVEPLLK